MTVYDAAREAARHFTTGTREDGSVFDRLRDDAPQWVQDLVREAHGDMLPDDHRYEMIVGAIHALADADPDADPDEIVGEWAADAVPVSPFELLAWLASNANRIGYCDDAIADCDAAIADAGRGSLIKFVMLGWHHEAEETAAIVLRCLRERAEA